MAAQQFPGGKFLNPQAILSQVAIDKGITAADFGCGSGYFSIPLAKAIGSTGTLYSLDVLPQALESVESRARVEGISNIITRRVNLEVENGSKLNNGEMDLVVLKDMIFQNTHKEVLISEAYRVLKDGGHAIIVEWGAVDVGIGPDQEVRIAEQEMVKLLENGGFIDLIRLDAGEFHYAFEIRKQK